MKFLKLFLGVACFLFQSCIVEHTRSTIADENTAYAITKRDAADIVENSMRGYISPDYFTGASADGLTKTGYYRMMLDTTTMTGAAIPTTGTDATGRERSGFGFRVTDVGTIIGLDMPENIYEDMKSRAERAGTTLRTP